MSLELSFSDANNEKTITDITTKQGFKEIIFLLILESLFNNGIESFTSTKMKLYMLHKKSIKYVR